MELVDRVEKLEERYETLNQWQRQAEAREARRAADEEHVNERLDKLEETIAAGFAATDQKIEDSMRPLNKIFWLIGGTAATAVIMAVAKFVFSGGLAVV